MRPTAGGRAVRAALVAEPNPGHGGKRMASPDLTGDEAGPGKGRLNRWLEKLGLHRPELRAWAMYDWANSAMVTTIITAVFPIYYEKVACKGVLGPEEATQRYATATVIGMVIIALLSPVLGTIADLKGDKKKMLGGFLVLGVLSVAGMFFIYQGDWLLASVLFILANIGANGSFVFYDALLPHVAREDEMDRVSTAGYALGYIGGGTLLALNLAWIMKPELFGLPAVADTSPQGTLPTRLAFLSVAVWWVVFSIPLFRRVPEPRVPGSGRATGFPIKAAFARLWETGRGLRGHKQAFLMLLAFLIYNDGIGTIIRMATHLCHRAQDRSIGRHRLDHDRAVRGHSVCVPLRHAGPSNRCQALDRRRAARVRGDLHFRLFHEECGAFRGAGDLGRRRSGGNASLEPVALWQLDSQGQVGRVLRLFRRCREICRNPRAR